MKIPFTDYDGNDDQTVIVNRSKNFNTGGSKETEIRNCCLYLLDLITHQNINNSYESFHLTTDFPRIFKTSISEKVDDKIILLFMFLYIDSYH